jgi:NAD(P)-dependent dehydrogenase (short-subunit alcohol dehydrogenase family)
MTAPEAADLLAEATSPSKNPSRRLADPAEIADVIVFLSSEEASFVNGATWAVDGGYTAL